MPDDLADLSRQVARLEEEMREVRAALARIELSVARIEAILPHLATKAELAVLPYLATKAELAEKPGKAYLWGVLAVLLTAYAPGLAALAILK